MGWFLLSNGVIPAIPVSCEIGLMFYAGDDGVKPTALSYIHTEISVLQSE